MSECRPPFFQLWREMISSLRQDVRHCGGSGTILSLLKCYFTQPSFKLVAGYRLSRLCFLRGRIRLARGLMRWHMRLTSCQVSYQARIGPGCYFPHPIGIVIGEGVEIGRSAVIFQHVTLGRRHIEQVAYPRIGNAVTLYTGSSILGGVTVGDGTVVGIYAVVMRDLPANTVVGPQRLIQ